MVCRMGIPIKEDNGDYITQCPCCGNSLFVLPTGFVCVNSGCTFKSGSIIEFLAFKEKIKLRDALTSYLQFIKDKSQYHVEESSIEDIFKYVLFQRQLFDFFLKLSHSNNSGKIKTIRQTGALHKNGIACESLRSSVYVLTKHDLNKLNIILKSNSLDPYMPSDANAAIVMPYYKDHHSISDLVVVTKISKQPTRIKIQPSKLSWFGLLQTHPGCKDVDLTVSYADSMVINSENARLNPDRICLHYLYNPTSSDIGWLPDTATFLFDEEPDEYLSSIACLRQIIPNLSISYHKGDRQDSKSFTLNYCVSVLEKEGLSPNARLIMESSMITTEDRECIAKKLHDRKQFALAQSILKMFKTQMVYHDEHNELYASHDGYFVKKGKSGNQSYVTNFTLSITDNVVFADTLDVFHRTRVNVQGREHDVMLQPQDIDKAQDLELAVRRKHTDGINESALPTIREKSLVRVVSSHLRDQVAKAPQVEGTPFLGWNGYRTRFFGPFFCVDATSNKTWQTVFHPNIDNLECYSNVTHYDREFSEDLPLPITRIIGQAVAFMVRSYLNIPTKAIAIHNSKNGRVLIESLFQSIGQVKPLLLNYNIRQKQITGINGYPAYCTADTQDDLHNIPYPLFVLCDGGGVIDQEYDKNTMDIAGQTFRDVLYKVSAWIIKTRASSFDKMASVSYADSYAAEGGAIICEVCQIGKWLNKSTEFKNLEAFLNKVSFDQAEECITHNINTHQVTLELSSREDIDIVALKLELERLGASYVEIGDGKISSDSISLLTAIEHYYQKKPKVKEIFDVEALIAKQ